MIKTSERPKEKNLSIHALQTQLETLTQRVTELEALMDTDVYLPQPVAMPGTQRLIQARAVQASGLSQPRPLDPDLED
jgi:cell division protein FtsB